MQTVSVQLKGLLSDVRTVSITETAKAEPTFQLDCIFDKVSILDSFTDSEKQGQNLITIYQNIFSAGSTDIGSSNKVHLRIELTDHSPFKHKYPAMIEEVRQHIEKPFACGIKRLSHSSFSSNVVIENVDRLQTAES